MKPSFRCPNCHAPLVDEGKTYRCPKGHAFDKAKTGYVNLILANQGRKAEEGDSKESILARKAFLRKGYYSVLKDGLVKIISSYLSPSFCFADIACGEGYYTEGIATSFPSSSILGIDISKAAILEADKQRKASGIGNLSYAVGNMDYLPLLDESMDGLLNCFAPLAEKEFLRVTKKGGFYFRVLPGVHHLYELKALLYESPRLNVPKESELPGFRFLEETEIEGRIEVSQEDLENLFAMTPYFYKSPLEARQKLKEVSSLSLGISFVVRVYQKD